jgi:hypothetical protein
MAPLLKLQDQADALITLVTALPVTHSDPVALAEIMSRARDIPEQFLPPSFASLVSMKFTVPLLEVERTLDAGPMGPAVDFDTLVPPQGWLHDYIEYTRCTEPPTVFHFFSGLTVMGAAIARRVYFPKGSGDIFPNICCVLVAPSGRCKKTTACNIAVNLFRRIGGNVLADKITPEAIVESFQTQSTATGLIYAPEWAVFLGKQQYMEGLVPMLTALFDCPSTWSSTTIMRGSTQLQNVALSHLAATTLDWMQTSTAKDAFSGGFMSRLMFIVQKSTPRSFPLPPPLDPVLGKKLVAGLMALQHVTGEVSMTLEAEQWYTKWYLARKSIATEKHFAGYLERRPDRLLQLAMVINASYDPKNLVMSLSVMKHADGILTWMERYLPQAFDELSSSPVGDDQLRLLRQIRKSHGSVGHSDWMRLNTTRMNSDTFRKCVETLKQAKMIVFEPASHKYFLLPAGKAVE